MSGLDLTEAIAVASHDLRSTLRNARTTDRGETAVDMANGDVVFPDAVAQALVELVAPLIVAQVRAQIAADILAEVQRLNIDPAATSERIGLRLAARIARGEL